MTGDADWSSPAALALAACTDRRGAERPPEPGDRAVAKAMDFARQIRKTPIVVNDARFFYANRCIIPYINEGIRMVGEGVNPTLIENAAKMMGMPLGPLQLVDETSIDLGVKIAKATRAAMGDAYPELARAQPFIEDTLKQEEVRFRTTLGRGMALFDTAVQGFRPGDMLDGQTAFTLSDTYGFPLDLTQDEARRRGFSVNVDGFEAAMAEQRQRSRENWKGSGQTANTNEWLAIRDRMGPTVFTGYDAVEGSGEVLAIMNGGAPVETAGEAARTSAMRWYAVRIWANARRARAPRSCRCRRRSRASSDSPPARASPPAVATT